MVNTQIGKTKCNKLLKMASIMFYMVCYKLDDKFEYLLLENFIQSSGITFNSVAQVQILKFV